MRDTLKAALRPAQHQTFQYATILTTNVKSNVALLTTAMEGESRVPWSTGFFLLPPSLPALCICSAVNKEAALRAKNPSGYHDQN